MAFQPHQILAGCIIAAMEGDVYEVKDGEEVLSEDEEFNQLVKLHVASNWAFQMKEILEVEDLPSEQETYADLPEST